MPPMKSANASSPRAKRKGDNPNVIPLINKICRAENNPFSKVVAERERESGGYKSCKDPS